MPESRVPSASPPFLLAPQLAPDRAIARALGRADLHPSYFARGLSFDFLNWPFSYWMAAYGAPLAYLIIIAVYAGVMNRADRRAELEGDR